MYLCRARLSARLASLCAYSRSHCAGRRRYTRTSHALIDVLLRNPELDTASAKQEIQWMADQIYGSCRTTTEPSAQLHQGYLEQLVQRRAAGEPLQYVLGESVLDSRWVWYRDNKANDQDLPISGHSPLPAVHLYSFRDPRLPTSRHASQLFLMTRASGHWIYVQDLAVSRSC